MGLTRENGQVRPQRGSLDGALVFGIIIGQAKEDVITHCGIVDEGRLWHVRNLHTMLQSVIASILLQRSTHFPPRR